MRLAKVALAAAAAVIATNVSLIEAAHAKTQAKAASAVAKTTGGTQTTRGTNKAPRTTTGKQRR